MIFNFDFIKKIAQEFLSYLLIYILKKNYTGFSFANSVRFAEPSGSLRGAFGFASRSLRVHHELN
jgi:hypothetical protein